MLSVIISGASVTNDGLFFFFCMLGISTEQGVCSMLFLVAFFIYLEIIAWHVCWQLIINPRGFAELFEYWLFLLESTHEKVLIFSLPVQ